MCEFWQMAALLQGTGAAAAQFSEENAESMLRALRGKAIKEPVLEQPKPASEQPKPVLEQPKPASEQPKPVLEQPKPASEQPKPALVIPQYSSPLSTSSPSKLNVQGPIARELSTGISHSVYVIKLIINLLKCTQIRIFATGSKSVVGLSRYTCKIQLYLHLSIIWDAVTGFLVHKKYCSL